MKQRQTTSTRTNQPPQSRGDLLRRKRLFDATRVAARLACEDADPLEFCDFGMLCAFDLIQREIEQRQRRGEPVSVEEIIQMIAQERQTIGSQSLHQFYLQAESCHSAPPCQR